MRLGLSALQWNGKSVCRKQCLAVLEKKEN